VVNMSKRRVHAADIPLNLPKFQEKSKEPSENSSPDANVVNMSKRRVHAADIPLNLPKFQEKSKEPSENQGFPFKTPLLSVAEDMEDQLEEVQKQEGLDSNFEIQDNKKGPTHPITDISPDAAVAVIPLQIRQNSSRAISFPLDILENYEANVGAKMMKYFMHIMRFKLPNGEYVDWDNLMLFYEDAEYVDWDKKYNGGRHKSKQHGGGCDKDIDIPKSHVYSNPPAQREFDLEDFFSDSDNYVAFLEHMEKELDI